MHHTCIALAIHCLFVLYHHPHMLLLYHNYDVILGHVIQE